MSITDHTINAQYEYRIANIVRKYLKIVPEEFYPKTGDELESMLEQGADGLFINLLLDDIQERMGFDELLKQVKGE